MAFNFDLKSLLGPLTSLLGQDGSVINLASMLATSGIQQPDQLARIMAAQGIKPPKVVPADTQSNVVGDLLEKTQTAYLNPVMETNAIPGGGSFDSFLRRSFPELFGPEAQFGGKTKAAPPRLGSLVNPLPADPEPSRNFQLVGTGSLANTLDKTRPPAPNVPPLLKPEDIPTPQLGGGPGQNLLNLLGDSTASLPLQQPITPPVPTVPGQEEPSLGDSIIKAMSGLKKPEPPKIPKPPGAALPRPGAGFNPDIAKLLALLKGGQAGGVPTLGSLISGKSTAPSITL